MRPKSLRSILAAVLIAVTGLSSLPPIYAGSNFQQAGTGSRTRRGKNGQAITNTGANSGTVQPSNRAGEKASPDSKATGTVIPARDEQLDSAQQSSTQSAGRQPQAQGVSRPARTQQQGGPPPFDRPPAGTTSQPRYEAPGPTTGPSVPPVSRSPQGSENRPQQDRRSTGGSQRDTLPPPATGRGSDRPAPGGQDNDDPQYRSTRQRPELRRPSDTRRDPQSQPEDPTANDRQDGPADAAGDKDEPIKLESTLVNIPLLVSDRSGRYVPRLTERDFLLYEDGQQQEIASFTNEEVPFNVVLLLDVSPSVQGNLEAIQDAAIEFVRQMRPQDRMMVASFDRSTTFHTDFTNNRRQLENAIRSVMTGSGTSVYDAVYEAVSQRLRRIEGRKALILFSDGEDTTSSQASYDDAVNLVTEADVLVYGLRYPSGGGRGTVTIDPYPRTRIPQIPFPIPFPWPWPRRRRGNFTDSNMVPKTASGMSAAAPQRNRGRDFMTDITAAGGGPVYDADQITDLSRLATRVAEELRHVYVLSYYPTNPLSNGGFRSIRIRIAGRDNIAVRHRRGYNAREASSAVRT